MKALALFSGGLDSILSAKVVSDLGIEVCALNFATPFTGRTRGRKGRISPAESAAMLGIEYREVYLCDEYLEMLADPAHGYGKNLNPCIDCKILFIKKAGRMLGELGASFLITGEVLGQRPMSQNKPALGAIAKNTGFEDLLLRPLSAKLLPATLPEREGWVDRSRLFGFYGRSRAPQIALAAELGIENYPSAAGGCLLTDHSFTKKIKDLIKHSMLTARNAELLKTGRHFRIDPDFKLVVGRDEEDNSMIENLAEGSGILFTTPFCPGPTGLGVGSLTDENKIISGRIIARYASSQDKKVKIEISSGEIFEVEKFLPDEILRYKI